MRAAALSGRISCATRWAVPPMAGRIEIALPWRVIATVAGRRATSMPRRVRASPVVGGQVGRTAAPAPRTARARIVVGLGDGRCRQIAAENHAQQMEGTGACRLWRKLSCRLGTDDGCPGSDQQNQHGTPQGSRRPHERDSLQDHSLPTIRFTETGDDCRILRPSSSPSRRILKGSVPGSGIFKDGILRRGADQDGTRHDHEHDANPRAEEGLPRPGGSFAAGLGRDGPFVHGEKACRKGLPEPP